MLMIRELPQVNVPEVLLHYDEEGARLNIEKAAYLGFAKAQLKMGAAYELCSLGCDFDPALSLHYNSLAARQGESEAEMAISKWFLCGYEGVFKKNDELAYVYAERAAQAGLATAEFAMGYFNEIGMHVPVNLEKAMDWYNRAAEQGNQDAIGRVEGLKKDAALSKDHEKAAIHRIRSQYGSKRGGRPDRFASKAPAVPPLPSVTDEDGHLPRSSSTAPYPMNDDPRNPPPRSSSTAPYPLDNGPPRGPTPAGGFFNPNGQGPPGGNGRGGQQGLGGFHFNGGDGQPPRPATTTNDPRGRPPQGQQRYPSGPGGYGGMGPGPAGQGQGPRANSLSPRPGPQQQPMQDIGFVAPLNPRRQSPGQSPVYGGQGRGAGGRGQPGPGLPSGPQSGRPPRQGGQQQPPPGPTRPGLQQQQPQKQPGPNRPGATGPGGPGGAGRGRGQKPAAAGPGNGPKTFEEMGIQAQKQDGECVSTAKRILNVLRTNWTADCYVNIIITIG
jgi:Sel1 repeat-containing protein